MIPAWLLASLFLVTAAPGPPAKIGDRVTTATYDGVIVRQHSRAGKAAGPTAWTPSPEIIAEFER